MGIDHRHIGNFNHNISQYYWVNILSSTSKQDTILPTLFGGRNANQAH